MNTLTIKVLWVDWRRHCSGRTEQSVHLITVAMIPIRLWLYEELCIVNNLFL